MEKINAGDVYDQAFGEMRDETVYYDPFMKVDKSPELQRMVDLNIEKAVNVGAASGAAGYAMIPLAYDKDIVDITRRMTPLQGLIPKITNQGTTANYYRITARGAAGWGTEQGALNEADDTSQLVSSAIKYCRITGRVTGVAQSGSQHFVDSMRQDIVNKTQTMNEELENILVNGDAATRPLEPNGLIKMLTSNNVDLGNADVSLTDVRNLVSACFLAKGRPNLLVTDPYTAIKLENQMMDTVRYVNPYQTFAWGLEALSLNTVVGRIPVIVSQFMPTTAGERRILAIDTRHVQWRVLQDITFEKLAKTDDSEKYFLKTYRTLINKWPEGMGQLLGIA